MRIIIQKGSSKRCAFLILFSFICATNGSINNQLYVDIFISLKPYLLVYESTSMVNINRIAQALYSDILSAQRMTTKITNYM